MTTERDGDAPGFDVVRRGYRTAQVDAWAREAVHRIEAAERDRDEARRQARALRASLDEAGTPDTFGARAERILRMAEYEARSRREQADRDAAGLRELARAEAERTVADARAEAARVRAEAEAVAARTQAEVADARRDADRCADAAAAMHEHVRDLRSAVRGEVARLHAALGSELRTLDEPIPAGHAPEPDIGTDGDDEDTVRAAVVVLPEQRDRPESEQVTPVRGTPPAHARRAANG